MAVNINRVLTRHIHANLNHIARVQVCFRLTQSIYLIRNGKLRHDGLIHTGFEQNPCVSPTWRIRRDFRSKILINQAEQLKGLHYIKLGDGHAGWRLVG